MPDYPVNERIARNLQAALAGIRTVGGYSFDVLSVERTDTPSNNPLDRMIEMAECDPERSSESFGGDDLGDIPGNPGLYEDEQTYIVCVYRFRAQSGAEESQQTLLNQAWADVVRAVMQDPTREMEAQDTKTLPPLYGVNCVEVPVIVVYRYRKDDPTKNQ